MAPGNLTLFVPAPGNGRRHVAGDNRLNNRLTISLKFGNF